ncbi:response regulator receiver domain protein [Leptospira fainei serovar Hurstbridge str. BUT 6]|uniref:Response regulator receiver domain protein n=1 Tax=Leptospira fainei serovar Hurstbridge str. BUT 6 TaxID=1193011 RepID=S3VH64_9LEPT|nr:response regulator [Leptospira fainei]EPG75830.1 response regulator receiver domain protein [Leptospira fainei serovar Hurstbridge str. BUT 6]
MSTNLARILVVEDESIVAKDIRSRLIQAGYSHISIARNGEEAIRRVIEAPPDLLLMDIMFSSGVLDGVETAMAFGGKIDVPVIFLTAYADSSSVLRTIATKPYAYVLKPFRIRGLQVLIEAALSNHALKKKRKEGYLLFSCISENIKGIVDMEVCRTY